VTLKEIHQPEEVLFISLRLQLSRWESSDIR